MKFIKQNKDGKWELHTEGKEILDLPNFGTA